MSIVPLVKVTVCGHKKDKARVLEDLQKMGCLHLIPLTEKGLEAVEHNPATEALEGLSYLTCCPDRRRQVRDVRRFDPVRVERRALELKARIQELSDELDFLSHRIKDLRPWGEFHFYPRKTVKDYRLWFYRVPRHQMADVEKTDLIWEVVGEDNRFFFVIVVAKTQPEGMPVARTRTGARSLSELERRWEEVEIEIEDLQAERAGLTKYCDLYKSNLARLEDFEVLKSASQQTYDKEPVFVLQGWAPKTRVPELETYAAGKRALIEIEEPNKNDKPPTLFQNPPSVQPGEALVRFYMTPSYWLWDPSGLVLFSFAIFFAMIISDAGYGALLGLGLALGWKKMGITASARSLRRMFACLITFSLGWGVLVGSYFGVAPAAGSILAHLKVIDLTDTSTMMKLSIIVGAVHIAYANLRNAVRQWPSTALLAPVGWVMMIAGGLFLYIEIEGVPEAAGVGIMGIGALLILLFTGAGQKPLKRLVAGLMGFTSLSKAFGDILSYLRLFALGLASASLALAFNDLAKQASQLVEGIGFLLAIVVLLIGHGLNLLLAIVSGFVHGLRLNLIEFFSWGVKDEGYPFRVFAKREGTQD
jgi:V/A-type H+-transporting ATPase subunit I